MPHLKSYTNPTGFLTKNKKIKKSHLIAYMELNLIHLLIYALYTMIHLLIVSPAHTLI